ncbi:hypothetical protein KQ41_21785 [Lysinibacillus fusiformis]|uniref:hypothetical protein n=1 Tax=Lysinibacillus fusiformis TaxID=28031 RepID=UPI0005008A1B|nr:hypothetical protein [Lysinibacillus fusiformis]KGA81424.1 hypothetical protein KQ41_21785 [Lysinibacillus fusiformis]
MVNDRFELHFIRTVNEVFDPWELSNFINDFGNEYYKFDLLRNIAIELENGVLPENIIILNNPIKRKYINNKYLDLKIRNEFNSFQAIGYPISMYPNKEIFELSLIIRLYKRLNSILNQNISITILNTEYNKNDSLNNTLNNILDAALNKLSKKSSTTVRNSLINAKNDTETMYLDFLTHENELNKYKKKLKNNELEDNTQLTNPHFDHFFELFSKISKPLVGVYSPENKKIKILCSNHLRKRKDALPELDFKRFGHNSPSFFDVATGTAQIGKTIYDAKKEQELRDEQIKTEQAIQKYIDKQMDTENLKQESWLLRNQILEEQLKQLKEEKTPRTNSNTTVEDEISEIQNNHIKLKVMNVYSYQIQNSISLLNRNKLNLRADYRNNFDMKA